MRNKEKSINRFLPSQEWQKENQKLQPKAFTLIELIVVITILIILWTIWFLAYQWYSSNARDWTRTSDISSIKTSLELFKTKTWIFPEPTSPTSITYLWWLARQQWTVWDQTVKQLWIINKSPKDPLNDNEYTYSVTASKWEYELAAVYEWAISYESKGLVVSTTPV